MLEITSVPQVVLLLLQLWIASSSVAKYSVNNNPPSAEVSRLPATNTVRPFNITTLGNPTNGTYSVHDHDAYCLNDDDWLNPDGVTFSAADCEDAIKDMVGENWNIDHRLHWSFPGRTDNDHQETPLKYSSGDCVLSVWPRYIATEPEDMHIREDEPVGVQHQDVASIHDVATLAYRVFEQCMVTAEHHSVGWIPAGDSNSLFVGFWEANSIMDEWADGLHAASPPAVVVT